MKKRRAAYLERRTIDCMSCRLIARTGTNENCPRETKLLHEAGRIEFGSLAFITGREDCCFLLCDASPYIIIFFEYSNLYHSVRRTNPPILEFGALCKVM